MEKEQCIFCKIANGVIPSETIYEDDSFRAILDLSPAAKGHTLILPKAHAKDIEELSEELAAKVLPLAAKIGRSMKASLNCAGYNLLQNNGKAAGQTVFHFHLHIIPRYEEDSNNNAVTMTQTEAASEELKETAMIIRNGLK